MIMTSGRLGDAQDSGALAVRRSMSNRNSCIQAVTGSTDFAQNAIVTIRRMRQFVGQGKTLRAE